MQLGLTDWFSVNSWTGEGDIQDHPFLKFCRNFSAHNSIGNTQQRASPGVEERYLLDTDFDSDMSMLDNPIGGVALNH